MLCRATELTRCPPYHWRPTPLHPTGSPPRGPHPAGSGRLGGTQLAPGSSQFLEIPARTRMAGTLKITRKNCQGGGSSLCLRSWSLPQRALTAPSSTKPCTSKLPSPFKSKQEPVQHLESLLCNKVLAQTLLQLLLRVAPPDLSLALFSVFFPNHLYHCWDGGGGQGLLRPLACLRPRESSCSGLLTYRPWSSNGS